jgi:DNA-binding PadR family transcriptional regulator
MRLNTFFKQAREHLSERHMHHHMHHEFGGRGGFFGGRGRDAFGDFGGEHDGMRGGRGGGRFGGRMFGTGDLKLLLLALIEQQPRHGYELIRTIEEMFDGQYSPSPGAIYPTLTLIEEQGYARIDAETGGKKLYAITDEGKAFLEENRDALNTLTLRLQMMAKTMSRMSAPMSIRKAMHDIKHALLAHHTSWDEMETKRIIAILEKAAADIAGKGR